MPPIEEMPEEEEKPNPDVDDELDTGSDDDQGDGDQDQDDENDQDDGDNSDDDDHQEDVKAESDESDQEEYGQKVQKRINKLTYEKKTERARRIKAEKEAERLRRQLSQSNRNAELGELNAKAKKLQTDIREAFDDGDIDKQLELQGELTKVNTKIAVYEESHPDISDDQSEDESGFQDDGDDDLEEEGQQKLHQSAEKWISNNPWYGKPEHVRMQNMAADIQADLLDEGYELSDELYQELDRRLESAVPRVSQLRRTTKKTKQNNPRRRSPVSGPDRGNGGMPAESRSNKLTNRDLKSMEKYGLNPNSPEDRKNWLNRDRL